MMKTQAAVRNYRIIPPELRNSFPAIHCGFDLSGKKVGDEFFGCKKCGVQTDYGAAGVCGKFECPVCTDSMYIFKVTQADIDVMDGKISPHSMTSANLFRAT